MDMPDTQIAEKSALSAAPANAAYVIPAVFLLRQESRHRRRCFIAKAAGDGIPDGFNAQPWDAAHCVV